MAGVAVVVLAILMVMVMVVMAVVWICIVQARRTQRKRMIQRLYNYIMEIAIKVFILQLEENKSHLKLDNGIASNSSKPI